MSSANKYPKRMTLRTIPQDHAIIDSIILQLSKTSRSSTATQSDAIKFAVSAAFKLVVERDNGRLVLRNVEEKSQEGICVLSDSKEEEPKAITDRTIEVQLSLEDDDRLDYLIHENFAATKTQVVRRALPLYWLLMQRLSSSWTCGIIESTGQFRPLLFDGINGGSPSRITNAVSNGLKVYHESVTTPRRSLGGQGALESIKIRLEKFGENTKDIIDKRMCRIATKIANSCGASVAWVFVKNEDRLNAIFAHKNRLKDNSFSLTEDSMAVEVANLSNSIAAPNVHDKARVSKYKPFEGMNSAMGLVLKSIDGETLGVFQLESTEINKYNNHNLHEYERASLELVPLLLMHRALNRNDEQWFPWKSFDVTSQLDDLCLDIRRAVPGVQCTIWVKEPENQFMFVYTTTGFALAYIDKQKLPLESFNGYLTELPMKTVASVRPGEKTRYEIETDTGIEIGEGPPAYFEESLKEQDGLKWSLSQGSPLYIKSRSEDSPEPRCTLSLSCFNIESESVLPNRSEMLEIANKFSRFLTGFINLRREMAINTLAIALNHQDWQKAFGLIKAKLTDIFKLNFIAIDGYIRGSHIRYSITNSETRPKLGLLTQSKVRLNSARTIHADVKDNSGNLVGVVHLSRSKPFTVAERDLAHRLAMVCIGVFELWRRDHDEQSSASDYA